MNDAQNVIDLLRIAFPLALLFVAYFVGRRIEARHYVSIRSREQQMQNVPAVTFRTLPASWNVTESGLAMGGIVVSIDHFKRFLAGLRGLVGGRVKSYESLLDRGRREALLRMKESAAEQGYDGIFNVRLETSRLASSRGDGKGTAGVEVLAYGTAVKRA